MIVDTVARFKPRYGVADIKNKRSIWGAFQFIT